MARAKSVAHRPRPSTVSVSKPFTPRKLRQLAKEALERAGRSRAGALAFLASARRWRDEFNDPEQAGWCVDLARLEQRGANRDRRMARHFTEDAKRLKQIRAVSR